MIAIAMMWSAIPHATNRYIFFSSLSLGGWGTWLSPSPLHTILYHRIVALSIGFANIFLKTFFIFLCSCRQSFRMTLSFLASFFFLDTIQYLSISLLLILIISAFIRQLPLFLSLFLDWRLCIPPLLITLLLYHRNSVLSIVFFTFFNFWLRHFTQNI